MRDIIDMQINLGPHPVQEGSDFVSLEHDEYCPDYSYTHPDLVHIPHLKVLTATERRVNRSRTTSNVRGGWLAKPAAVVWRSESLANGRVDHLAWLSKHKCRPLKSLRSVLI